MRSHGGGRACYFGQRPPTGSCEACRATNARQHTNYNRSPAARAVKARYDRTAKGQLARVRSHAKERTG